MVTPVVVQGPLVPEPQFKLVANGKDITASVRPLLINLATTDDAKQESDTLTITLVWRPTLSPPHRGAVLELSLGWTDGPLAAVGRYVVDERQFDVAARTITLTGKGTPFNPAKDPKSQAPYGQIQSHRRFKWPSPTTLGAVVQAIAARNGLAVSLSPELSDVALSGLYQHGESDLHLLNRLARQHHAVLKINGGTLVFTHTLATTTPKGKALPQHTLHATHCSALSVRDGGREEGGSVVVKYRAPGQKKASTVSTGGGPGPTRRMKKVFATQDLATAAANSAFSYRARSLAVFSAGQGRKPSPVLGPSLPSATNRARPGLGSGLLLSEG